jgi:hypothetical protein
MRDHGISRRDFVRTTAASSALFTLPHIRAEDKAGTKCPVLGTGEHTYECIHDWPQLPDDIRFGNTHGVIEDAQGYIYIKHTVHQTSQKGDAICVFDPEGKFVRSWGAEYRGVAHGLERVVEGANEFLWFSCTGAHLVRKVTLTGEEVLTLRCPMESGLYNNEGEFVPTNTVVGPDGRIYVADGYGKSWIHIYNAQGQYLKSFGGPGKERGQLSCPHGLYVDCRSGSPVLVVADRSNRRLQIFDLDGKHLSFVTSELRAPCHFHTRGEVLLIPDLESRVTLFDGQNKLIVHLGDGGHYNGIREKDRSAFAPGKFVAPHGANFDAHGNIYVAEWVEAGRVTKLRRVS